MNFRAGLSVAMVAAAMQFPFAVQVLAQVRAPVSEKPAEVSGDLAFGRFIALIRGHLLAGDELVKRRDWSEAYPHFNFTTEEIYGVIRDELHIYNTPPFDGALKALARTVQTRNARQYPKALEKVEEALGKADRALKAKMASWPLFQVTVAIEVLKTAADEYDEAIANGRIAHAIGYRSARGFVLQAGRMIDAAAPGLPAGNEAELGGIRAGLARLNAAFIAPSAPDRPPIDDAELLAVMTQIEAAAARLRPPL